MTLPIPWQEKVAEQAFVDYLKSQRRVDRLIARSLIQAGRDLEQQMIRLAETPGIGAMVRSAQLAFYQTGLQFQWTNLWRGVGVMVQEGINQAATDGLSGPQDATKILLRAKIPAEIQEGLLVASVRSSELIRARILNAIPLSQQVYRTSVLASGWLQRTIYSGLARNLSAKELAREVRRFVDPTTRGGASYAASRLARTEINNAFHQVTKEINESYPWVEGVQWRLSGSHPRADDCDDLANKDHEGLGAGVFSPRNVPSKPHPQCLCHTVAVTVEPEEFADRLLSGGFDRWLQQQGYSPIGKVA